MSACFRAATEPLNFLHWRELCPSSELSHQTFKRTVWPSETGDTRFQSNNSGLLGEYQDSCTRFSTEDKRPPPSPKTGRGLRSAAQAPCGTCRPPRCSVLVRVRSWVVLRNTQRLLQGSQRPVGSHAHWSDHVLPADTKGIEGLIYLKRDAQKAHDWDHDDD